MHMATTYSRIIITELCLPPHLKTIKPHQSGGIAGKLCSMPPFVGLLLICDRSCC
jgi:hypothetical protein